MGVCLVIISDQTGTFPRSHVAHSCAACDRPRAPHVNRRFDAMPVEKAIIEQLRLRGPCCLDDVATYLPDFSWAQVFLAVNRMSRNGKLLYYRLGSSASQIALRSQVLESSSTSSQKR